MRWLREAWWRVGLPDAISWPAFFVTLLAGIIGNFANSSGYMPQLPRLAIVLIGQVGLWIPLVILRFTLVRDPNRSRPVLVLFVFLVGSLLRAFVMVVIITALYGPQSLNLLGRFLGIFVNIGPTFIITAIVVSSLRERRRQISNLAASRERIEASLIDVDSTLLQRNADVVERVRRILEAELEKLEGAHAERSLEVLQRTAVDVVRPMSHELGKSVPKHVVTEVDPTPVQVPWTHVLEVAASDRPYRPWILGALFGWELLGMIIIRPDSWRAFVLLEALYVIGFAVANQMLEFANRGRSSGFRITITALASLVVSWSIAATVPTVLGTSPSDFGVLLAFVILGPGFALGTAVLSALARERERVIAELTESAHVLGRALVRQREVEWFQQKSLSRVLHGPIQSAVTAAAIRLDASIREGTVQPDLLAAVRGELLTGLDVLNEAETDVADLDRGIERMKSTYAGLCSVDSFVSEEAGTAIAADGVLRSCVIDIVTEAVSNAVWHGKADQARVEITLDPQAPDVLLIEVSSSGRGSGDSERRGLGTQQLDDWTLAWSREIGEQGSRLKAALPVVPTGQ